MSRLLIVLGLLLIVILGNAQALSPEGLIVQTIFRGNSCQLNCFMGVEPLVTTESQLMNWLSSQNIEYTTQPGQPVSFISWHPTQPEYLNTGYPIRVALKNGLVDQIWGGIHAPVDAVLEVFGAPPVTSIGYLARNIDPDLLVMAYPQHGIAFHMHSSMYSVNVDLVTRFNIAWPGNGYSWSEDPDGELFSEPCSIYGVWPCVVPSATPTLLPTVSVTATATPSPTATCSPTPANLWINPLPDLTLKSCGRSESR
jgi:hypothetical protein